MEAPYSQPKYGYRGRHAAYIDHLAGELWLIQLLIACNYYPCSSVHDIPDAVLAVASYTYAANSLSRARSRLIMPLHSVRCWVVVLDQLVVNAISSVIGLIQFNWRIANWQMRWPMFCSHATATDCCSFTRIRKKYIRSPLLRYADAGGVNKPTLHPNPGALARTQTEFARRPYEKTTTDGGHLRFRLTGCHCQASFHINSCDLDFVALKWESW